MVSLAELRKQKLKETENQKESSTQEKKSRVKKKIGISERKLNKNQTLDAIYKLARENIGNITDIKLRSILEDIKVYSGRGK